MTTGFLTRPAWGIPFRVHRMGWVPPALCLLFGAQLYGWRWGVPAGVLLLATLLLHEVGHMLAARALGVPVREFGLCLVGAYTKRAYSTRRRDEIVIAAAGPLMNILLAWPLLYVPQIGHQVAVCSLLLGVANLIPMPSSDGLRIWRNLVGSEKARGPVAEAG